MQMPLGTLGHKVATVSLSISLGTVGWDFEKNFAALGGAAGVDEPCLGDCQQMGLIQH